MITITENALEHLIDLMMKEGVNPDTHYLRVGVKGGGCSGLSYIMEFDDKINDGSDELIELDGGVKVIIDRKSLLYIFGTELDYSDGLNGKGFHWVNPNSARVCGCGSSFSV
jgi:iron-sulfur cluster assembly protein